MKGKGVGGGNRVDGGNASESDSQFEPGRAYRLQCLPSGHRAPVNQGVKRAGSDP